MPEHLGQLWSDARDILPGVHGPKARLPSLPQDMESQMTHKQKPKLPAAMLPLHLGLSLALLGAEVGGGHATTGQRVEGLHLVLHERQQRRDHHGHPASQHSGELHAKRARAQGGVLGQQERVGGWQRRACEEEVLLPVRCGMSGD